MNICCFEFDNTEFEKRLRFLDLLHDLGISRFSNDSRLVIESKVDPGFGTYRYYISLNSEEEMLIRLSGDFNNNVVKI
jgi:hypothetical protein